jgi:hypothetical protein
MCPLTPPSLGEPGDALLDLGAGEVAGASHVGRHQHEHDDAHPDEPEFIRQRQRRWRSGKSQDRADESQDHAEPNED